MTSKLLHSGFLQSAATMPDRPALNVGGKAISYGELLAKAAPIAATLQRQRMREPVPLTAVFAERSITGFAGILGTLLSGRGYVPLNVGFPAARTRRMFHRAGCASVVVDAKGEANLGTLLDGAEGSLLVVAPETNDVAALARRWPGHTFAGMRELKAAPRWQEQLSSSARIAYLLFTSGSTGEPKGVAVTHRNVTHFIDFAVERYDIGPEDRFSQMFDTTFDLSVFDLFVAWQGGACVYCPPRAALLNPDRFIRDNALTVWFSVPTVGLLLKRFGALQPNRYPSLRWSLFCGEPLPIELAEAWTEAAPTSRLENLYGPTELTVACTAYRWDPVRSPAECLGGLVPIGRENPGMRFRVVNHMLRDVPGGSVGELLMAGPQRTPGYWRNKETTERAFIRMDDGEMYYRTGDRVMKPVGLGPLTYVGRRDHQIKVLGHRVELGEVESALRQEAGVQEAVAVGWPPMGGGAAGVAAFLTGRDLDPDAIRASLQAKLHGYAVPQTIRVLPAIPQNANGKVDRQALIGLLRR